MFVILLIVLCLVVFVSCSETKLPDTPLSHFTNVIEVKPSRVVDLELYDILKPCRVEYNGKYVILEDHGSRDKHYALFDNEVRAVCRGIRFGQGGDEISPQATLPRVLGDSIWVVDVNRRRALSIEADNGGLKVVRVRPYTCFGSEPELIGGDRVLSTAFIDSAVFLKLTDWDGKVLSHIGFPDNDALSSFAGLVKSTIYSNTKLAVSPDCKHFAFGVLFSEEYGFGKIEGDSLVIEKEYVYSPLKIGKVFEQRIIVPAKENRTNTTFAEGTDMHALFLYSGAEYASEDMGNSHNILVYSWGGSQLRASS